MALPGNMSLVWVRGTFLNLDGSPMSGRITFSANVVGGALVNPSARRIIGASPFSGTLDADTGYFQVQLPATNDPDVTPVGFTYSVVEPTGRKYSIVVPFDAPALDSPGDPLHGQQVIELSDIVPAPGASGGTAQLLRGRGVASMDVDGANHLVVTYSDDTTEDLGVLPTGSLANMDDLDTTGAAVGQVPTVTQLSPLTFGLEEAATGSLANMDDLDVTGAAVGQLVAVSQVSPLTFELLGTAEITPADIGAQPVDSDLTTIAGLTPADGDLLARVAGAWAAFDPAALPLSDAAQAALDAKAPTLPMPAAGRYFYTTSPTSPGSGTLGNNALRLAPWVVTDTLTIDRIGAEISTAGETGSKFRLGIYADTGDCYPGDLLLDAGQINGDSATLQELTVSLTLSPGLYWIGGVTQSAPTTQPAVRRIASTWTPPVPLGAGTSLPAANAAQLGYSQNPVSGALPGTFSTTVAAVSDAPRVFVRAA